jgi:hypothetical protein
MVPKDVTYKLEERQSAFISSLAKHSMENIGNTDLIYVLNLLWGRQC